MDSKLYVFSKLLVLKINFYILNSKYVLFNTLRYTQVLLIASARS